MKLVINKKTIIIIIIAIVILVPSIVLPIVLTQGKPPTAETVNVTYMSEDAVYYTITTVKGNTLTSTAPLPTREDYEFLGWYLDEGVWTILFDTELPINEDTTVFALWQYDGEEEPISYTVAVTGGLLHTGLPVGVFLTNTQATITADVPEGQRFVHWTLEGTETVFTDNPHSFGVNTNLFFTAVFESIAGYFEVVVEGGTVNEAGSNASFEAGNEVTVRATIPEGKSFVCWQIGEEEIYLNPYIFILESDITLTAVFEDRVEESDRGLEYTFDESSGTYFVTRFVNSGELFLTIPEYYDNGINGRRDVTRINQNVFENTSLNMMIIPSNITHIGESAFSGCAQLDAVYIPDSVDFMGNNVFSGCNNLTIYTEKSEKVEGWQLNWNGDVDSIIWGARGTGIKDNLRYVKIDNASATIIKYLGELASVRIPHTAEDGVVLTQIAQRAFLDKSTLKKLEIQAGMEQILEEAFMGCYNLLTVIITRSSPPILASNVFEAVDWGLCVYVPDVSVNDYKIATGWNGMSDNIYSIDIISGNFAVKDNVLIQYLGANSEVIVPDGVIRISLFAFATHRELKRLTISADVQEIEGFLFAYDYPLFESISVAAGSQYFAMQDEVLYNKAKTRIVWYSHKKTTGEFALPDTVTEIADYAFLEAQMDTLYLKNTSMIGQAAFYGCSNLTSVYFDTLEPPDIEDSSFENRSSLTLYVPAGSLAAYAAVFAGFNIVEME